MVASGFLATKAVMRAAKFVSNCWDSNLRRPILEVMKASELTLNSMRPSLLYLTCSTISSVLTNVPLFLLGIKPFGPRILAYFFRF